MKTAIISSILIGFCGLVQAAPVYVSDSQSVTDPHEVLSVLDAVNAGLESDKGKGTADQQFVTPSGQHSLLSLAEAGYSLSRVRADGKADGSCVLTFVYFSSSGLFTVGLFDRKDRELVRFHVKAAAVQANSSLREFCARGN